MAFNNKQNGNDDYDDENLCVLFLFLFFSQLKQSTITG